MKLSLIAFAIAIFSWFVMWLVEFASGYGVMLGIYITSFALGLLALVVSFIALKSCIVTKRVIGIGVSIFASTISSIAIISNAIILGFFIFLKIIK